MTKKISTPFATSSTKRNDVPVTTAAAGQASYNIGFPDENFISLASGGIAPDGKDFNGVLFDITSNISDLNKGLPQYFDADFSALINGYPLGARLCLNDNSGFVVSIVANNTQDPNANMTSWVLQNKKHAVDTISDLKNYNDISVMFLSVNRYTNTSDVRSGGNFYYDASDTTTTEDGVFVFTSSVLSGRWKRVLDNTTINITQGGLIGLGDESDKLNNLLKACENQSTVLNYSRKFTVDGLQMIVNTSKQINLNLTLVTLNNIEISVTLPDQATYNNTTGCGLYVLGTDSWTNNPTTYRRKTKEYLSGVTVSATTSNGKNTLGLYLQPNNVGQFANSIFQQANVNGFDYSLVLTSNCFLINFNECDFAGANNYNITTSTLLGIDASLTNMGENIKFTNCTLSNCVQGVLKLDAEMWLKFIACSFDYHGKSTDTTGWFELLGNIGLDLISCHYESGNDYAQLGDKLFRTTSSLSSVNIDGGTFSMGEKNNNRYVFYSEDKNNYNFTVNNVWVWGPGIAKTAWSNTGMGRFRLVPNSSAGMGDVNAPAVQAPNKSLTADYNFVKSNLLQKSVDQWFVSSGGDTTRTSQISSSGVTGSYTTTTDENGNTVPCLKLIVNKSDQSVSLLIKRPKMRNAFNPAFRLRYKSNIEVPGNLFASVVPVDVSQEIDVGKGVFVPNVNTSRWDTSIFGFNVEYKSNTDVKEMRYLYCNTRAFQGLETYDYYMFNWNFSLRSNFELYILSAECYDMDN